MKYFGLFAAGVVCLSSAAVAPAADLVVPAASNPVLTLAGIATPMAEWAGPYAGAGIGFGTATITAPGHADFAATGFTVGGQAGYNFDLGQHFVAGVQADAAWSSGSGNDGSSVAIKANWTASLTARAGYAMDTVLPYVLGGLTVTSATGSLTVSPGGSDTQYPLGWTAGFGGEMMLADRISAFAEYRYTAFAPTNFTLAGSTTPISARDSSVVAGVNYRF